MHLLETLLKNNRPTLEDANAYAAVQETYIDSHIA